MVEIWEWGIYGLNGWASYGKVSYCCFLGGNNYALNNSGLRGVLRDWNLWLCGDWKKFFPLLCYSVILPFRVQRDRNLWSCDDQKTSFHCSTISLFAFSSTPCQLLYLNGIHQIRLFIMKEKLITDQIKMQPGRLPCLSKPKKCLHNTVKWDLRVSQM